VKVMQFQPGDKVRLTHDVGSSFYERNEIYISGTKGSIATILTPEEFFLLDGSGFHVRSEIAREMKEDMRYPVRYEQIMPLLIDETFGFDIINHRCEGGVDLIYAYNLEKVE